MTRMSASQLKALQQRGNKYGAQRTTLDGHVFASKAEANYYAMLKVREKAGEVFEVQMQRPYALTINGYLICTYRADFAFYDAVEKRNRVIDVKGVKTKEFIIKSKMMKAIHGIDVEVVK
jgi:hypothetical protein